ncbi:lyase family protein [Priestia megaterium]|uniref:lyase family protein n=1 Tax=Priestia megaterium TaxID=1404 RepID=UPI0005C73DFB|nr:lyase family protein [Priestia megaterium]
MSIKSIVFIESNTTGTGEMFIKESINMGYNVFFLSNDPFKYSFLDRNSINFLKVDTNDVNEILKIVNKIPSVELVFTSSEYFVEIVNQVNGTLGLKSNNQEAISACRNKEKLYATLIKYDLCPKAFILSKELTFQTNNILFNRPYVVKPTNGSGSKDVKFISSQKELERYAEDTEEERFILQEYFEGDEYSVEVMSNEGKHYIIGIVKKQLSEKPNFIEVGHDFPANLSDNLTKKIKNIVAKTLNIVGYINGASHIELRVHKDEIRIIEINPRLAGGMIPLLIEKCSNINLIKTCLLLYLNKTMEFEQVMNNITFINEGVIRFKLPEVSGVIKTINYMQENSKENVDNISSDIINLKKDGDVITLQGDFRDRVVCIISSGPSIEKCDKYVSNILEDIEVILDGFNSENDVTLKFLTDTGRLNSTLHPYANDKVNSRLSEDREIEIICDIDEAHLLMLVQKNIIPYEHGKIILKEISKLKKDKFQQVLNLPKPRGLYMTYEGYIISKVGKEIGGNLQISRSRNDINATINNISIRDLLINLIDTLLRLTASITLNAIKNIDKILPIYSQYQIALPGRLGHYLMAAAESLLEKSEKLIDLVDLSMKSPLGAGSGGGTTIPIDVRITSELLGFKSTFKNSLNAVSNRDLNIRVNNDCSIIALTLSRIAQDLQVWSTTESLICSLPDYLCGGSSAMPQKKNPYLLEWIKARTDEIMTMKDQVSLSILKTPLSNSFEVSGISTKNTRVIINNIDNMLKVMNLIINNLQINEDLSKKHLLNGNAYMSEISEFLYTNFAIPFRESHHYLGELASNGIKEEGEILREVMNKYGVQIQHQNLNSLERNFGMGPGEDAVNEHILFNIEKLNSISTYLATVKSDISEKKIKREKMILEII